MTMKTKLMDSNFRVVADYTRCAFSVSLFSFLYFIVIILQPCGGLAYGVGANGHTSCWNVQTGKLLDTGSSNDDISYISCAWSTKMAASGSKSKLVTLWTDC